MKLATVSLTLACALLASCATDEPRAGVKAPTVKPTYRVYMTGEPVFTSMAQLKKAFPKAVVTGTTIDFKGGEINGKRMKHLSNSQDENNPYLKFAVPKLHMKNFIANDIPGGMTFAAPNCRMTNGIILEVGEDAFSTNEHGAGLIADKMRIYNTSGEGDKSGQWNSAHDGALLNSYITGGKTALRIEKKGYENKNVRFTSSGNTFEDVVDVHHIAGDTHVTAKKNTYIKVKNKWVISSDNKATYSED